MDRSMDSIGSCSLDVDAESSDISDTSGSLNFPTPISIKDITREFTNNIRERCSLQTVKNTTAYVDPVTGQVCIALTQAPTATTTTTIVVNNNIPADIVDSHNQPKINLSTSTKTLLSPQTPEDSYDKKPSYLNLACCVNGYSNITTYDSKIRQDINKSREVSPIRPSSSSLHYCKKSNSLAPPVLLTMANINVTSPQPTHHQMAGNTNGMYVTSTTIGSKYSIVENNTHSQNGLDVHNTSNEGSGDGTDKRSFIQQRVERLYGPGALAQGFYSPKKIKDSSARLNKSDVTENGETTGGNATSELARKFQELSPSKDYNQFRKKLSNSKPTISPNNNLAAKEDVVKLDNNNIDLPCLRHLSQEFRAQLPVISPKRNFSRTSPGRDTIQPQTHTTAITNGTSNSNTPPPTTVTQFEEKPQQNNHQQTTIQKSSYPIAGGQDELDRNIVSVFDKLIPAIDEPKVVLPIIDPQKSINAGNIQSTSKANGSIKTGVKDAHFFLRQLKEEQNRLLLMAAQADKYLVALENNSDISEDTLGFLRSASGKARLLVSQKMKQFEGLCHNHLNSSPNDQFPTTVDDLQGFWDMVYLQVDHVDSIFADIEKLKNNDWKKPLEEVQPAVTVVKTNKGSKTTPFNSKSKPSTVMTNGADSTAAPSAAAVKREAQRKKLQEMKRRNREALAAASANSNSTTHESSPIEIVGVVNANNETNTQQIR